MSDKPNIDQSKTDIAIAVSRGVLSQLPYAGPILAEIVGAIIPNQRMDRLVQFAKLLDEKLGELDREMVEQKMLTEEFVDLFEDGAFQAARALTNERRERIACLLKNSLASEELDHVQEKQLLSILGELNDAELVILGYYGTDKVGSQASEYWERHQEVLLPPLIETGMTDEEADRAVVQETYRDHLRRLGLVRATYKKPKKGELPEWDLKTGMIKAGSDRITPLGRLLLRYIDA